MELQTERLLLRPVREDDFEMLYNIFTNEAVRKYLLDDIIVSADQVKGFIAASLHTFQLKSYGLWLLTEKSTGETVGVAGLRHFYGEEQPQLLYALLPQFTGRGYATETATRIIAYSFEQLLFDYLIATCDVPNQASHNVAQRVGMKKKGEEVVNGLPLVFYEIRKP